MNGNHIRKYRNHPVGQVSEAGNLHSAQDSKMNVPSSDHCKALVTGEVSAARKDCHCLLSRINQIWILLSGIREGSETEDPVLALQSDIDTSRDVVASQHRHSDSQIC